jgi:hypothetical protein
VSAPEIVRDEAGLWVPGHTGNPTGRNQFSDGRPTSTRERIERRFHVVAAEHLADPVCVETIVRNLIDAMMSPEELPLSARIAFERLWPVVAKHELSTHGGDAPGSSASQWDALAERAGEQVSELADVAGREPEPVTVDGVD